LLYGMVNKNQISWNQAIANWGVVTHIGVYSAASGGNLLLTIPLESPVDMPAYATFRVAAGGLAVTLSGGFMPFVADRILNWLFRDVALQPPSTFRMALGNSLTVTKEEGSNAAITSDDTMVFSFAELTGGNYARVNIPNSAARWPVAVNGIKTNAGATINFLAANATWEAATAYVLYDTADPPRPLFGGNLDTPLEVANSDVVQIPAGEIEYTFV
jgi:hypothetical protein